MNYEEYNREERDLCAHLFRLLLHDQKEWSPLREFLKLDAVVNPRIYCEVALIRDAYYIRKPNAETFIEDLCSIIAEQEGINKYIKYTDLSDNIRDPNLTHPKQISMKLKNSGLSYSTEDGIIYGCLQAMFNAKPDLAICSGNSLVIIEAKYTLGFDKDQLKRTQNIGEVWAKLLYKDLGFDSNPILSVKRLGLSKYNPDLSWDDVYSIALRYLGEEDYSVKIFKKVLNN